MLITCKDCGTKFQGTPAARYCKACVKRRISDSAKRRRLCYIGAGARWGKKQTDAGEPPQWAGRRRS